MSRHWNQCAAVLLSLCLAMPPVVAAPVNPRRQAVISGAMAQVGKTLFYDPAYVSLSYPGGDVPLDRGVCTDVVVRAFRSAGVDLQRLVHEDMHAHFNAYPHRWGLRSTDSNIDHRRVPNLMTFFTRKGHSLSASKDPALYQPGDVVAWRLSNGLLHTGVVSDQRSSDGSHYLIIHNIGAGAKVEDVLFAFEIIGHYRYF
jgi:uncharacterized protein